MSANDKRLLVLNGQAVLQKFLYKNESWTNEKVMKAPPSINPDVYNLFEAQPIQTAVAGLVLYCDQDEVVIGVNLDGSLVLYRHPSDGDPKKWPLLGSMVTLS